MRLIGQLKDVEGASNFSALLANEGIKNNFEPYENAYRIWVEDENNYEKAKQLFAEFQKNPREVARAASESEEVEENPPQMELPKGKPAWKVKLKVHRKDLTFSITNFFLIVCTLLFVWINFQEIDVIKKHGPIAAEINLVPVEQKLIFDYSEEMQAMHQFVQTHDLKNYKTIKDLPPEYQIQLKKIDEMPSWKGIYDLVVNRIQGHPDNLKNVTLFHDIRQGEVWRLFTPALLHFNFLHILFNMAWLWILGRQIEMRLGKMRLLVLSIIVGIVSNVFQYLMSGPLFLGYSGIVVGMAGFIWVRQKLAPWEGYPLPRNIALFLLFFVLAIFALEIVTFILEISHVLSITPNIANTAHIVGGLSGMVLARVPYFARKVA